MRKWIQILEEQVNKLETARKEAALQTNFKQNKLDGAVRKIMTFEDEKEQKTDSGQACH